eukprot:gene24832-10484_t
MAELLQAAQGGGRSPHLPVEGGHSSPHQSAAASSPQRLAALPGAVSAIAQMSPMSQPLKYQRHSPSPYKTSRTAGRGASASSAAATTASSSATKGTRGPELSPGSRIISPAPGSQIITPAPVFRIITPTATQEASRRRASSSEPHRSHISVAAADSRKTTRSAAAGSSTYNYPSKADLRSTPTLSSLSHSSTPSATPLATPSATPSASPKQESSTPRLKGAKRAEPPHSPLSDTTLLASPVLGPPGKETSSATELGISSQLQPSHGIGTQPLATSKGDADSDSKDLLVSSAFITNLQGKMNASLEPASLHLPMGRALANAGGWAGSGELSLQPASLHLPMGRALANAGGWAGSGELSLMPASLHLPMGRALANARGRAGSGASSPTSHRKTEILYHVQHAADGDGCELRDLVHRDRALVRPMLGEGDGPGDSYQLPLVHGDGPGDSYKLPLVVGDGPGDSYQLPLVVGDGPGDSYKLPLVDGDEDGCGLRDLVQRDRDLSHPMLGEGDRPGDSYQLPLLGGDRHGLGYMLSDRDGGGEGEDGYGGFEAGKSKSGREIPLERCADRHGDTGPRSSDETSLDLYEDGHGGVAGRGYDEHPGGRGGTSLDGYEDGREGFEASGYDERPGKGVGSPLDGGLSPSHVAGDADSIYGEEGEEVPVSQSNKSERTPGNATLASHMLTPGDLAVSQMVGVDSPSSRECSPTPPVDVSVTTLASARFNKSSYDNPLTVAPLLSYSATSALMHCSTPTQLLSYKRHDAL